MSDEREIYESNMCGKFEVLEKTKGDDGKYQYKIRFLNTGYEKTIRHNPQDGANIKDYLAPLVHGIGCRGYLDIKTDEVRKEYAFWERMISRCYNENDQKYQDYGGNCIRISDRWLRFEYFLEDIHKLDNWDKEKFYNNEISLDKDYKNYHNHKNMYNKENCMWVTGKQNYMYQPHKQKLFKLTAPDESLVYYHFNLTNMCEHLDFMTRKGIEQGLKRNENNRYYGWKCEYIDKFPESITPYNIEDQFEDIYNITMPLENPKGHNFKYTGSLNIKFVTVNNKNDDKIFFKAINPEGDIYYHYNMSEFARNFKEIKSRSLSTVLKRENKSYKGWKFEYTGTLPEGLSIKNINSQFNNI